MAADRSVKDRSVYIAFRVCAALFGLLPWSLVRWVGSTVGSVISKMKRSDSALLLRHMRRALGESADNVELQRAVEEMYCSYGRYWAETFWFRPRRSKKIIESVERVNFGPVYDSMKSGRGIVFALPHIGNWEVAGLVAGDIGLNLMAVAEDLPNKLITKWFLSVRERFGIDIVLTSDPERRSKMIRRLKEGGALALLSDRDVTGKGVTVTFFGEETTLPAGPTALAELTDSTLIPVASYFLEGGGFKLVVGDPVEMPVAETRAERVVLGAQKVAEALEEMIRNEPSQWHLFQPNWPSDRDDVYKGQS